MDSTMSDEKTPAELELDDAVDSIRETGESATGNTTVPADEPGEQNPNPALPDWGSDGVAAEDEPAR